jgi:transposase InsO family protein
MVAVIDSCTRLVWAEVVKDIKSLTVMFSVMRCFQVLQQEYGIKFQEALTDNGPEFGKKESKSKENHPFERMLMETGIKHRYIRPYRPQTNGKIERFWRTIEEDMLQETYYDSFEELENELIEYLYYYNHERPHQGIDGDTPANFNLNLSTK